ncbi:helix-turn-helix domain-containing protein [Conexibacter sp. JD483]|uniref:PucR family transcriptional regulator n=1 Tax=unclassified Conexibacter TaxID=2627773 RepID=UPI002728F1AA|nr:MULTISPECIES: helix-turn-helix domain-containing protein [unclassified Conexibacter]MDO8188127.1 helix-turn-helix domain-containing protein [Conexibacter sp. CPCC 205706]MDO8201309.1 helix-turn-helix domain-containing protein [Conexibacter sp. CPCC 205762]MDR9370420.1 helix-turn-helix domain-containing protein [Conexibacter sp. JD483]
MPPVAPERINALLVAAATAVLQAPDEVYDAVDRASLSEHDPEVAADPVLLAGIKRSSRAMMIHWANCTIADPTRPVPPFTGPEMLGVTRDLVRRGLDTRALEPFRAGQNSAWQAWMEIAFALIPDPDELQQFLRLSAQKIFTYVDATNVAIAEQLGRERDALTGGTNAERLSTVMRIIEAAQIDLDRAERRLGYDLRRTHVAAVAWASDPAAEPLLDGAAGALAAATGTTALSVTASSATVWCWAAAPAEPDLRGLEQALRQLPGVRVALGSRGRGVEGFRRSHFDALATQRTVERLGSAVALARYDEIRVAALLTQDEQRARGFVEETVGALARAPRELRETLRTYLRAQSNATRAARELHTHRNTVVSRIAKAEALLPRPLEEAAIDVAVALEVLHWSR